MVTFALAFILGFIVYMVYKLCKNANAYQQYYWKQAWRQIAVACTMIWNGVILNKGHHSLWKEERND